MRTIADIKELGGALLDTDTFDRKHLPGIKCFIEQNTEDFSASAVFQFSLSSEEDSGGCRYCRGPCHSQYLPDESTDYTVNIFTRQHNKKFSKFYLDYLLSDDSPWKSVLGSAIVLEKDSVPVAIVFPDMSVNIHVLTNFLIATRMSAYWFNAEPFYHLVNHFKFSKPDAFLLSLNFYYQPSLSYVEEFGDIDIESKIGGKYFYNPIIRGYVPNDMPFYFDMDAEAFRNGTPIINKALPQTLKDGARPQPCNHIWGGSRIFMNECTFTIQKFPYSDKDIFGFVERELVDPDSPAIKKLKKQLRDNKKRISIEK